MKERHARECGNKVGTHRQERWDHLLTVRGKATGTGVATTARIRPVREPRDVARRRNTVAEHERRHKRAEE